jgi:hypothetical protein
MKLIPEDVRESLTMLYSLRKELPDGIEDLVLVLIDQYRDDIKTWDVKGVEPDWNRIRGEINGICHEAEMPNLCEVE